MAGSATFWCRRVGGGPDLRHKLKRLLPVTRATRELIRVPAVSKTAQPIQVWIAGGRSTVDGCRPWLKLR